MAIERIRDGRAALCEMRDLKKGDRFRIINDECPKGPWMIAQGDADQRPSARVKGKMVWHCKAAFAGKRGSRG
jgi:hypothetical protein